jgi:hypothetical protein
MGSGIPSRQDNRVTVSRTIIKPFLSIANMIFFNNLRIEKYEMSQKFMIAKSLHN